MYSAWGVHLLLQLLPYALLMVGVIVLFRAFVSDRSRGKRRCPSCWYDMSSISEMTCPECGRAPAHERRFYRTRRHWRHAGVGVVIIALSCTAAISERVRQRGAMQAIPTLGLIAAMPWMEVKWGPKPPGQVAPPLRERMHSELLRRSKGEMWRLERWLFVSRAIAGDSDRRPPGEAADGGNAWRFAYMPYLQSEVERHAAAGVVSDRLMRAIARASLTMRDRWPMDQPLRVKFEAWPFQGERSRMVRMVPRLEGAADLSEYLPPRNTLTCGSISFWDWDDGTLEIGTLPARARAVVFDVQITEFECGEDPGRSSGRVVWAGVVTVPIRITRTSAEAMQCVEVVGLEEKLREHLAPRISLIGEMGAAYARLELEAAGGFRSRGMAAALRAAPLITVGGNVVVSHAGVPLGRGRAWWREEPQSSMGGMNPRMCGPVQIQFDDPGAVARAMKGAEGRDDGRWTVTLIGNASVSIRDLESARCWAGEVSLPLAVGPSRWPP